MPKCKFKIKGLEFNSELELNDFLTEKYKFYPKLGDVVFSETTPLALDVMNKLKIHDSWFQTHDKVIKERKTYTSDSENYEVAKPLIGVNEFLSGLLNSKGGLLFPEFREEKFWENKFEDWEKGVFTDEEKELIFNNEETSPITSNVDQEHYRDIIQKKWNKQGKIGTAIHKVCQYYWVGNNRNIFNPNRAQNHFKKEIEEGYLTSKDITNIFEYCKGLKSKLELEFGQDLLYYPEFKVKSETIKLMENEDSKYHTVLGTIDLLVVDGKGNAHIIDYKTSPHPFIDYPTAKQRTFWYQMAVYKRILKLYGIKDFDSRVFIAPIKLNNFAYNEDTQDWAYDGIDPSSKYAYLEDITSNVNSDSVENNINELLPDNDLITSNTTNLLQSVADTLKEWIPNYSNERKISDKYIQDLIKDNHTVNGGIYSFCIKGSYMRPITAMSDVDLFKSVKQYYETLPASRIRQTHEVMKMLSQGIEEDNDSIVFNKSSKDKDGNPMWFQEQLRQYSSKQYELIENEAMSNLGIILLRNKLSNQIDIVKITTTNPFTKVQTVPGRTYLSSNFEADVIQDSKKDSAMLKSLTGNAEIMEAMLAINQIPELFINRTLGNIRIIDPYSCRGMCPNNAEILYTFKTLNKYSPIQTNNFEKKIKLATFAELALFRFKEIILYGESVDWRDNRSIRNWERYKDKLSVLDRAVSNPMEMIKELTNLKDLLEADDKFKSSLARITAQQFNVNSNPEIGLYYLILEGIAQLKGTDYSQEIADSDNWMEKNKIWTEGWASNMLDNPGHWASKTLNVMTNRVTEAYQNIRDVLHVSFSEIYNATNDFKNESHFYQIQESTIGNQASLYKKLTKINEHGNWVFKTPSDPSLNNAEIKYLNFVLKNINSNRFNTLSESSMQDLIDNTNSEYYWVPMHRGDVQSLVSTDGMLTTAKKLLGRMSPKNIAREARLKAEGIFDPDQQKDYKDIRGQLWEMNNMFSYSEKTMENRIKLLSEYGEGYFEHNLETVMMQFSYSNTMQETINEVMPIMKSAMVHLAMSSITQNTDFKNDMELIEDYVANKVLNKSLIPEKYQTITEYTGQLMGFASKMSLLFSPVAGIYQMIEGIWKDISIVWRKPYGQDAFGFKELKESWKVLLGDMVHYGRSKTKSELLNSLFAMNDMDMNTYVERNKSDRAGIFHLFDSVGFKFASRPDFYNRMTLFNAQMMKDGTWEAYSVKDNHLIYDWKLDKRFEAYANKKTNDPEYAKQKALYFTMANKLVQEGARNSDGTVFEVGQSLPKAYTTEQSEAYKSLGDMVYGYYAHEKKSLFFSTWLGAMFGQFRTYWSGKKNQYLAPGGVKLMGNYEPMEENGVKYYQVLDENGVPTGDITTEDTGVPFMRWTGQWQEGIVVTISKSVNALLKGGITKASEDIWNKDDLNLQRAYRNNLKQFMFDIMMWSVIGGLCSGLLRDWYKKMFPKSDVQSDEGKAVAGAAANIMIKSFINSGQDFNFLQSLSGGITEQQGNVTPMFLSTLARNTSRIVSAFDPDSETTFYDVLTKSFSASRVLEPINDYVKYNYLSE